MDTQLKPPPLLPHAAEHGVRPDAYRPAPRPHAAPLQTKCVTVAASLQKSMGQFPLVGLLMGFNMLGPSSSHTPHRPAGTELGGGEYRGEITPELTPRAGGAELGGGRDGGGAGSGGVPEAE
jgi:hypothetical protein